MSKKKKKANVTRKREREKNLRTVRPFDHCTRGVKGSVLLYGSHKNRTLWLAAVPGFLRFPPPHIPPLLSPSSSSSSSSGGDKPEEAQGADARSEACLYLTESKEQEETIPSSRPATAGTGEGRLIASLVNHVLQVAVSELQVGGAKAGLEACQQAPGATERQPHTATACAGAEMNEFNNNDTAMDEPADGDTPCLCFHGSRRALEEFKSFLQDTPGEKVLHLWMDIERLRTLASPNSKNR